MFVRRIKPLNQNKEVPLASLNDFGYNLTPYGIFHKDRGHFISKGHCRKLRKSDTASEDLYGAVSREAVKEIVSKLDLQKLAIPINAQASDPKCFIYHTEDAFECQNLVVLVTGVNSGPGIWDIVSIAKHGVLNGSVVSLVQNLQILGYGVVLLNPAENAVSPSGEPVTSYNFSTFNTYIKGSESPDTHVSYVWEHVIKLSKAQKIVYISSANNGQSIIELLNSQFDSFTKRVCGVVCIQSSHSAIGVSQEASAWTKLNFVNFLRSSGDFGSKEIDAHLGCYSYYPLKGNENSEKLPESESEMPPQPQSQKSHLGVELLCAILDKVVEMFSKGLTRSDLLSKTITEMQLESEFTKMSLQEEEPAVEDEDGDEDGWGWSAT